jgi:dynein heavy chain
MNAQVGTYDPEQIDYHVSTYYRNIMKLERTFMKIPAPLAIAKTVNLIIEYL